MTTAGPHFTADVDREPLPGTSTTTRSPRGAATTTESEHPVNEPGTRARKTVPPHSHAPCGATWTGASAAHCSGCCQTFSGVTLFDRHRSLHGDRGTCTPPAELRDRDGNPICEFRDGIWRFPEMTEEQKLARFGAGTAA